MNREYVILPNPIENAVPHFTGQNIPLAHFIEGCKEAQAMVPQELEQNLILVLRSKLRGEARGVIRGEVCETVDALLFYLKELYEPSKSLYQLIGEMGGIFQRDDESALSYTNRVRTLGNQILDVARSQTSWDGKRERGVQGQLIVCQICNKIGHSTLTCYQRNLSRDKNSRDRCPNNSTIDNNNNNQYKKNNVNSNPYRENKMSYNQYNGDIDNRSNHDNMRYGNYYGNKYRNNDKCNSYYDNYDSNIDNYDNDNLRSNIKLSIFPRELENRSIGEKICHHCKLPRHHIVKCTKRRDKNRGSFTKRPPDPSTDGWTRANNEENLRKLPNAPASRRAAEGRQIRASDYANNCGENDNFENITSDENAVEGNDNVENINRGKRTVEKNINRKNNNRGENFVVRNKNLTESNNHGKNAVGRNNNLGNDKLRDLTSDLELSI
ncbi:homeobox protein 4-like [Microplitis mediator]|uniref:homeobox protein 4-like n=1 Tax=Microplitis mediator TaxID=375433 RepID=UPI00255264C1|nr:homeobox protein 4-like [Microplitis mediator]